MCDVIPRRRVEKKRRQNVFSTGRRRRRKWRSCASEIAHALSLSLFSFSAPPSSVRNLARRRPLRPPPFLDVASHTTLPPHPHTTHTARLSGAHDAGFLPRFIFFLYFLPFFQKKTVLFCFSLCVHCFFRQIENVLAPLRAHNVRRFVKTNISISHALSLSRRTIRHTARLLQKEDVEKRKQTY